MFNFLEFLLKDILKDLGKENANKKLLSLRGIDVNKKVYDFE